MAAMAVAEIHADWPVVAEADVITDPFERSAQIRDVGSMAFRNSAQNDHVIVRQAEVGPVGGGAPKKSNAIMNDQLHQGLELTSRMAHSVKGGKAA
jgi:hypothetical protein